MMSDSRKRRFERVLDIASGIFIMILVMGIVAMFMHILISKA